MTDEPETPPPFTLRRWSQRKLAAARTTPARSVPPATPVEGETAASAIANVPLTPMEAPPPLPPVESLDFDSDFSVFMQPKVDEATQRAALKKLFSSPSFNVMDGLDIYVGDYTQSDPMPAGMLEKLSTVYAMLDTREPPPHSPDEAGRDASAGTASADVAAFDASDEVLAEPRPPAEPPELDAADPDPAPKSP